VVPSIGLVAAVILWLCSWGCNCRCNPYHILARHGLFRLQEAWRRTRL